MTKRRILIVGFVMAAVACAAPAVAYVFRDPVNQSNSELIQEGMTEADVIRILGRPSDFAGPFESSQMERAPDGSWREEHKRGEGKVWQSSAGTIEVAFDESGFVIGSFFVKEEDSIWPRIRRWLGINPDASALTPYRIHGGVGPTSSSI